ncbi:MAG: arabinogalactan endo-1,4-beta-galactosidase [Pseudoflavonifractor sp.]|nr:arabinogalactan endo-1,4-beta-galactosidase [Alloprevotella sp.]MCM1117686.1 arabinogalactan endo-1,4-beta-galactosidase [Pseudoflavonifractor sp.]
MRHIFTLLLAIVMALPILKAQDSRYVGGDISLLPHYEEAGAQYKTHDGRPVANVLTFCRDEGMNAMRVRVFVNPEAYDGPDKDPNACQDIESVIPLCRRIKEAGLALAIDFMYSDTWADPSKQWTPRQWEGLSDGELVDAIHAYTLDCLSKLSEAGAAPDFIQAGNEISFGMLWGPRNAAPDSLKKTLMGSEANWKRLGALLRSAISACREGAPQAKVIIHTERVADIATQRNFYTMMRRLDVDYDIIGVSYYPYFHGSLSRLSEALGELETDFPDKDIMVVETGYPYKWEVPGTTEKTDYPYTDEGQGHFARDLVATLEAHPAVNGLFWWWMEYNAYGTSLSGWYNAPLFDSATGRATAALHTLCSFARGSGLGVVTIPATSSERWHDLQGRPVNPDASCRGIIISPSRQKILRR